MFLDGGPTPQPSLLGSGDPAAAPEPATYGLVGAVMIGLALVPGCGRSALFPIKSGGHAGLRHATRNLRIPAVSSH